MNFVADPCTSNKYQFGWLDLNPRFAYEKGITSMGTLNAIESSMFGVRHICW